MRILAGNKIRQEVGVSPSCLNLCYRLTRAATHSVGYRVVLKNSGFYANGITIQIQNCFVKYKTTFYLPAVYMVKTGIYSFLRENAKSFPLKKLVLNWRSSLCEVAGRWIEYTAKTPTDNIAKVIIPIHSAKKSRTFSLCLTESM